MVSSKIHVVQSLPGQGTYNTVRIQLHDPLKCDDCLLCSASEDTVLGGSRNAWIILGRHIEKKRNLIPGRFSYNAIRRQIENTLKFGHGCLCAVLKLSFRVCDDRDRRIVFADARQPGLDRLHIKSGAAHSERRAGIGGKDTSLNVSLCNFDILRIIGAENIKRCKSLLRQRDSSPLGQPLAGCGGVVAKRSKVGCKLPFSADIFVENIVHDPADGVIDWPDIYEILVID